MDNFLKESFATGNVQLFVGSGMSSGLYPDPPALRDVLLDDAVYSDGGVLTTVRELLGEPSSFCLDDVAEFYELYHGTQNLLDVIRSTFSPPRPPAEAHKNLWKLPHVRWIYTTNFDCLIEDALTRPKAAAEIVTRGKDIRRISATERVVFKPHGCARRSASRQDFVISRNDYLNYSNRRPLEALKTAYDIVTKTFLFLGYSLRDLNMRHIIAEANRSGLVRSYAVLRDTTGPESRYWKNLGVTLIRASASDFLAEVLLEFPAHDFEWDEKVQERLSEKEQIASKALDVLKEAMRDNVSLNVIIDAGSTTLYLARALAKEALMGFPLDKIRIISNSPAVIEELDSALRAGGGRATPTIIGGPLRYSTRAFTPDYDSARTQLGFLASSTAPTFAFVGATGVDLAGLKTNTDAEVAIKRAFVESAQQIYLLLDHSKTTALPQGFVFATWDCERMTIITDRPNSFDLLRTYCNAVL